MTAQPKTKAFDGGSLEPLSLVDDTADFVDTVMRGVVSSEFSEETANVVCRCSNEISKLMRLRWEIAKVCGGL